jgi:hypothetical protein
MISAPTTFWEAVFILVLRGLVSTAATLELSPPDAVVRQLVGYSFAALEASNARIFASRV